MCVYLPLNKLSLTGQYLRELAQSATGRNASLFRFCTAQTINTSRLDNARFRMRYRLSTGRLSCLCQGVPSLLVGWKGLDWHPAKSHHRSALNTRRVSKIISRDMVQADLSIVGV